MCTVQKMGCIAICHLLLFYACCPPAAYQRSGHLITDSSGAAFAANKPALYRNDIPLRAVRELQRKFPSAKDIDWQLTDEMGWIARFTIDAVDTRIDFGSNAVWTHIYYSYTETPSAIGSLVAKKFNGYSITSVRGVTFPSDPFNITYSVYMSREDNFKIITLYKGDLSVLSDFDNSPSALK